MKNFGFESSIKFIKDNCKISNEAWFNSYKILGYILDEKRWKSKDFYGEDTESYNRYSSYKFGMFIKEVYGINIYWFNKTKQILELKNGKDLLLEFGKENLSTYINHDKDEQKKLIKAAKKTKSKATVKFSCLSNQLFPSKKKKRVKKSDESVDGVNWEKEYNDLLKNYNLVVSENKELREQLENWRKIIGTGMPTGLANYKQPTELRI